MPHISSNRRTPATTVVVLVLLLACLGLVACGGSSKSSSTSTNASAATTTTGTTGAKGPNTARFAAVRECLQKNGITLPKRTPGQKRPSGGAGGFLGGGAAGKAGEPQLPKGVTRAQYEAALKKCGGGAFAGRGGARFKSPAFQAALAKFATCMRENGVNVPAPNTSGSGPVFDTKGIDTSSTQFKAAETKCQSDLRGAFRRGPGAGGSPNANGAPPGAAPPSSGEAPGGAAGPPAG
jgi:hypothetical protein